MHTSDKKKICDSRYANRRKKGVAGWARDESYPKKIACAKRLISTYDIQTGSRFLELGCGAGNVTLEVGARGLDAYGIDISSVGIAWANDNATERGLKAHFCVGSVVTMEPYKDAFFDLVFDGDCLWMVIGDQRGHCFSSIYRVLKPGGILYARAHLVNEDFRERYQLSPTSCFDPMKRYTTMDEVPMYWFSRETEFIQEVQDAGFQVMDSVREDSSADEQPFIIGGMYIEARKPFE